MNIIKNFINKLLTGFWYDEKVILDLQNCVNRIPKDLITWSKEIKRLSKKKKDRKSIKMMKEYIGDLNFYTGKLTAYIYVLQELNGGNLGRLSPYSEKYIRKLLKSSNKSYMNKGLPKARLEVIYKKKYEK